MFSFHRVCPRQNLLTRGLSAGLSNLQILKGVGVRESDERVEISKLLLTLLWPTGDRMTKFRVVGALGSMVASKVCIVKSPLYLGKFIGGLISSRTSAHFRNLTLYGLTRVSSSVFEELRRLLFVRVSQQACSSLSRSSFQHLHQLDTRFLGSTRAGDLQMVISRAVKATSQLSNTVVFQVLPTFVEFLLTLSVLTKRAGKRAGAATTASVVSYIYFTSVLSKVRARLRQKMNTAENDIVSRLLDSVQNSELVRLFGNEFFECEKYSKAVSKFSKLHIRLSDSLGLLNLGQQIIFSGGLLSFLALAARGTSKGTPPVGDVVTMVTLITQLGGPLNSFGGILRESRLNVIDIIKLNRLLKLPKAATCTPIASSGVVPTIELQELDMGDQRPLISFRNVSFQHSKRSPPILNNVTLDIYHGQKVALVGPSGGGKSTLLKLLLRLYDPVEGEIFFAGVKITDLDLASLRRHLISIVPQDCSLFHDSLLDNIRYGKLDASREEVVQSANLAEIHDRIEYGMLPFGYDTVAGDRGSKLSGGERQRIAIARCLLKDAPVVLFDEATSSLDTDTERKILRAVRKLTKNKTSVVVAHRLSTIYDADRIFLLEGGRVVESGTHFDLIGDSAAAGNMYKRLWESQFRRGNIKK
jgi:ATP-binding cassette subfamily B (MDR/TAP) protein 7